MSLKTKDNNEDRIIILNNYSLLSLDNQKDLIKFIENINTTAPILISKSLDNLEEDIKKWLDDI